MKVKSLFKSIFLSAITVLISVLVIFAVAKAGSLTPSSTPQATLYTLSDIYTRLTTNATATEANHSLNPSTTPAGTFYTLKQIYDAIPTIDSTKILTGTTYLGIAGTMANIGAQTITPTTTNTAITQGYHNGSGYCAGDANLTAGNIKNGVQVFGITGTASGGTPIKTGQTTVYTTNDDGTYQSGLAMSYTDVTVNGIKVAVTDNNTNLMWQKCSAGLSGSTCATGSAVTKVWTDAILYCERLHLCTDGTFQGSEAGEGSCASNGGDLYTNWRLSNVVELFTLPLRETGAIAGVKSAGAPYINQTYFPATVSNYYWSSTTLQSSIASAFNTGFSNCSVSSGSKDSANYYVRCVR